MNNSINGRFGAGFGPVGGRSFGSTGHFVHMRGILFQAIDQDIYDIGGGEMCVNVPAFRNHKVANKKPVPVKVYDYYDLAKSQELWTSAQAICTTIMHSMALVAIASIAVLFLKFKSFYII